MKANLFSMLALLLISVLFLSFAGCQGKPAEKTPAPTEVVESTPEETPEEVVEESAFKEGDTVAAPWGGGQYHGTVKAVDGETVSVLYTDDGVTRDVKAKDLTLIKEKTWKAGDRVLAVWSSGKFYEGTIEEDKGDSVYIVKWDDGSEPSEVKADKIIALSGGEEVVEEPVKESAFKEGDTVAAPWGGGQYHGTVKAVDGETVSVLYTDDGVTRDVEAKDLTLIKEKNWKVGDKVLAVWSSGKFYEGTIEEDKGDGVYIVKWDDGSEPSEVKADKIIALGGEEEEGIKVGDTVAAPWGGGQYHGTVKAIDGETISVLYTDDGVTRDVKLNEITPIETKKWKVGDEVLAVWSSGKFYEGTIEEDKGGDVYIVKWEDGSEPSEVKAEKIMKK